MFFKILALAEIGGLGRSLAKKLPRLIVKMTGFGAVALARSQDRNRMGGAGKFHDLRGALASGAHQDGTAPGKRNRARSKHSSLCDDSAAGRN